MKLKSFQTYAGLALVAFLVYLPGFWWGAPYAASHERTHSWGVDDQSPLGPLAAVHNLIEPQPDRYVGYPMMHSFLVTAAYAPYLCYLWLTGQLHGMKATYPFGLANPVLSLKVLTWIAHLVSVFMGVGIILASYDIGQILWNRRTGVLSAFMVMTLFPMFYYARTGNVEVPVLFFSVLALNVFCRCITTGITPGRAIWLGFFIGCALGTMETAFASFVALPVVLLIQQGRNHPACSWSYWKMPLLGLAVALLMFGIASGLFFDLDRYIAHVEKTTSFLDDIEEGKVGYLRENQGYPYTLEGHFLLAKRIAGHLADTMTFPGLLISLIGVLFAAWRERKAALFALTGFTYLIIYFWTARVAQLRYILPGPFVLTFFAARAISAASESRWFALRTASVIGAICIIGLNLLRGIDLTHAMIYDSRNAAAAWLAPRTIAGQKVEYFGPAANLPALKEGVTTHSGGEFMGGRRLSSIDNEVVQEIMKGWEERKPEWIILIPDYTNPYGVAYSSSCPPIVYEYLRKGTFGYRLAAFFETPPLLPWIRRPLLDYPSVNPPIRIYIRTEKTT